MTKTAGRVLARLMAGLIAWTLLAPGAMAAPALWVVRHADSTLYLFGTIHLLEGDANWHTPAFDAAYASASVVWFETDVDQMRQPGFAQDLIARYGVDPDHPLSGRLSRGEVKTLKARARTIGIPWDGLDRFRPWSAAMMLSVAPSVRSGFRAEAGADAVISSQAAQDHKTLRYFETAEQQIRFLADLPDETQVKMLRDSLHTRESSAVGDVRDLETAWTAGDLDTLGPLVADDMRKAYPALYAALVTSRNRAWADALAGELERPGVEMVNVGALHMVGDDGLPALLRARGFMVERVQ